MNKLREIREKKEWTIKDTARYLDLRYDVYVDIENGALDTEEEYTEIIQNLETHLKRAQKPKSLLSFAHPIFLVPAVFKGGTGKSTSVENIAGTLAEMGYQVLICDTDGQCDTTYDFVSDIAEEEYETIYDAMEKRDDIRKYILHTEFANIDIVPSDPKMRYIEEFLTMQDFKEHLLEVCFAKLIQDNIYDFVIMDVNNQMAKFANVLWNVSKPLYIYSIFQPKSNAIKQFFPTMQIIENYKEKYNQGLYNLGAILNQIDERTNSTKKTRALLGEVADEYILPCHVRTDETFDKAQEAGMPAIFYKKSSKAARDYKRVVNELLRRIEVIENGVG